MSSERPPEAAPSTLVGHSARVYSVAFSPDGRLLASASHDNTIKLWDVQTGKLRQTLISHFAQKAFNAVAFSPDGRTLAAASNDEFIRLWALESHELRHLLEGHASVSFSSDGQILASGSRDGVRLWNPTTGQRQGTLPHVAPIVSVAISPDRTTVAAGDGDGNVLVWDLATRNETPRHLEKHAESVEALAFSSDGRWLAAADVGSSQGYQSGSGYIWIWDTSTGLQRTLKGHTAEVAALAFSPDGKTLASGSYDGSIHLWDPASGTKQVSIPERIHEIFSVAFSSDGSTLALGTVGLIEILDSKTGELRSQLEGHRAGVVGLSFSSDGKRLASASETVKVWDLRTRTVEASYEGSRGAVHPVAVIFSPDGTTLASAGADRTIKLTDVETMNVRATLEGHLAMVWSLAFSPDGKTLASASLDYSIKLWDTKSGAIQGTLLGHTKVVRSLVFLPDGRTLVSVGQDGEVRMWNVETNDVRLTLTGDLFKSVAISPDGKVLATGGVGPIHLWDAKTGNTVATLHGHDGIVRCVVFSPDGALLASASSDHTVRLWNTRTGRVRAVLEGHGDLVWAVAFSPNGRTLASAGNDGVIQLWDVDDVLDSASDPRALAP